MKNRKLNNVLTLGFALFAMFFGAGNLLLPPMIGVEVGSNYFVAMLAFGLTGILLPFTGILSVVFSGNNFNDLGNRVDKRLAAILGTIIMICIGPLIAIPRTAATTFEVGIKPFFPTLDPIWGSMIFFAITILLAIRPSKVVDVIGNYLTPVLLVLLFLLITMGILNPTADFMPSELTMMQSFSKGFIEGYQTLDVLASVIFAGIIIAAARNKGYTDTKSKSQIVIISGLLSTTCLLFVYGGLIYLGATSGETNPTITRAELLIEISRNTLGHYGLIAIALCMAFACLTTSIALTSAVGTFFGRLTNGKLSYSVLVVLCTLISFGLSIKGVDEIINFAYPPLAFVYPITITLVIYIVLFGKIVKSKTPFVFALLASTIIAILGLLKLLGYFDESTVSSLNKIPFFEYDLGWVVPSIIGFGFGLLIDKIKK
ncbi:branched-chain amino acid transport system II carrier protein [Empedobacter stercoris]|uniref:Branched-chain amino acid transport system II carrier protein n=1 Tax=Empedobacter falsenii TaxID=343874 RepID=A0ABY8V9L3_9FLAO|nr:MULTISPECIES: branched-chain amino acid transport system II carrier protein [Empedobacter]MDM1522837.1 branched-chain amino acid transport system II carrier protein [Empedobacter sp. 225-1]MDM1542776.1 branched-chain amino acid transport system II carrier protein [Empedobacter sp. 189-2]UWX67650.1 branched-chain amino acid transport system II carrier protein [Empedobacter stercoris]WIH97837.1 branched-chain amino acid transport system II carrier protein [Empedobacter falsenii]